jgi:SAM-dependent methyltransferase
MTTQLDEIWQGAYKIPWDDPAFSRRMLNEHLSQNHDLASRRSEWIDRQVAWIHGPLLNKVPSRILDLGCGPGFYSHRLATLGHHCLGIDFGPASIEYARERNPCGPRCEFSLGDLRRVDFSGPYDLAMLLYGELNVFSPTEVPAILRRARSSLSPTGRLIAEVQTPAAVERIGRGEPSEQFFNSGLFADGPHRCLTKNRWLPDQGVAVQTFSVTESESGHTHVYRSTTKAWSHDNLIALLKDAGFRDVSPFESWPCNTRDLVLWSARPC